MPCTKNAVSMAIHWNTWKTPLDTAVSILILFSTSFVMNNLAKAETKVHVCHKVKMASPHDVHEGEGIIHKPWHL